VIRELLVVELIMFIGFMTAAGLGLQEYKLEDNMLGKWGINE